MLLERCNEAMIFFERKNWDMGMKAARLSPADTTKRNLMKTRLDGLSSSMSCTHSSHFTNLPGFAKNISLCLAFMK